MHDVAALYVDPRGPYPKIPGVDCWDESRDARKYDGPHPVVAHPACGPWGCLAHLYRGREGGPELGLSAIEAVRKWGGVLEHPAYSRLWGAAGIPKPGEPPDAWGGYSITLNQVEWGHACKKPTWLYLVGIPHGALEQPPYPGQMHTHWIGGSARSGSQSPRLPGIKAASAEIRRRTPPEFAAYLVRLARAVQR